MRAGGEVARHPDGDAQDGKKQAVPAANKPGAQPDAEQVEHGKREIGTGPIINEADEGQETQSGEHPKQAGLVFETFQQFHHALMAAFAPARRWKKDEG